MKSFRSVISYAKWKVSVLWFKWLGIMLQFWVSVLNRFIESDFVNVFSELNKSRSDGVFIITYFFIA